MSCGCCRSGARRWARSAFCQAARPGRAQLGSKATITDITDPLAPIGLVGNATLQMQLADNGEPGASDMIGLVVWDKNGALLFWSRWSGTNTAEQVLGGGNLQVR